MKEQTPGGFVGIIVGLIFLVFSSPIARHLATIDKSLFRAKINLRLYEKINIIIGLVFVALGALGLLGIL